MRYPCGYFGTDQCHCKEVDVRRYQKKISGPILDRIDLQVEMSRLSVEERFAETRTDVSPIVRAKVEAARERQVKRFEGKGVPFNAAIPAGQIRDYCRFSPEGFEYYKEVVAGDSLSTRSMDRLAKVARTVADFAGEDEVSPPQVKKAGQFVIGGMLRENL